MVANTPRGRKAKGREFQKDICGDILSAFDGRIKARDIHSTGMSQPGCDIYLSPAAREHFPFGVECKRQEQMAIWAWWQQARLNADREGLTPLLVFKKSRMEPMVMLAWDDFLDLCRRALMNG